MSDDENKEPAIRFCSSRYNKNEHEITFTTKNKATSDIIMDAVTGCNWFKLSRDEIIVHPVYENPPQIFDKDIAPYWPHNQPLQEELPVVVDSNQDNASVIVKHIGGYTGNYEGKAKVLTNCGFECMRSQRSEGGRYWEIWYLPGKFMAKGPIKGMSVDEIRNWVSRNIRPGNISLETNEWGLSCG